MTFLQPISEHFQILEQLFTYSLICLCRIDGNTVNVMHYENLPMQYTEILSPVKIENFIGFLKIFFLFLLKT